jgi:oxygen-independent coproporphyrinogen-3 oxidase
MTRTLPLQTASPLDRQALPTGRFDALYVHVPFCFHKCHYCDFYSITRQSPERMERYVDLVLAEAELWADGTTGTAVPAVRATTIFFGGGTPSLLPLAQMERLLRGLAERFDLADVTEWTLEANPATVEADYCAMLRDRGVNRLSFGAQSFDRAELAVLERHHDPEDVPRSVEIARSAGFERLNVDLIYAIPGQSFESWMASLERAVSLRTTHLSCYGLTYEPNTPMAVRKRLGQFQAAAEELELRMMHATRRRLGAVGMEAYEISNYAQPGQECRHNLLYWSGENYLGLGPAAASHLAGTRWRNRPHLGEWETAVGAGTLPATEVEILSRAQRAGELVMLQLRLKRGVKFAEFAARTGYDARELYAAQIEHLAKLGLIIVDNDALRLTETGLNVADAVAAEFLHV